MHANVLALGPQLREWARAFTNDLNEAYYLTHETVQRLMSRSDRDMAIDVETAERTLREVAHECTLRSVGTG